MGSCVSKVKESSTASARGKAKRAEKKRAKAEAEALELSAAEDVKATAEVMDKAVLKAAEETAKASDETAEAKVVEGGEKESAADKTVDMDKVGECDENEEVVEEEVVEPSLGQEAGLESASEDKVLKTDVEKLSDEACAETKPEVATMTGNKEAPTKEMRSGNDTESMGLEALMVGTLTAVRAGIVQCMATSKAMAVAEDDAINAARRRLMVAFSELTLAIRFEMVIEEEAYFHLVDKHFDNAAIEAGLDDAHRHDETLEHAVDAALHEKRPHSSALDEWRDHHLQHIKHELSVVPSPLAQLPSRMGGAKAAAEALQKRVLGAQMRDMPWFTEWNAKMLSKHSDFAQLVDWASALRRISDDAQWATLEASVMKSLSEEQRSQLQIELCNVRSLVA